MKKLISLLAALAVVTTGTVAFAAETTTEVDVTNKVNATNVIAAGEDGLYSVTASSTADQATILAIKGKTIKVGAIQYINQAPTTEGAATFSFALNDALLTNETSAAITDDVYVLTGGDGNVTGAGYIDVTPEENTGYTVSGTVENFVSQDFIDEDLIPYIEEVFEGDDEAIASYTESYAAGYATRVRLYDKAEWQDSVGAEYLAYYAGEDEAPNAIATATVDSVSGTYTLSDVANGEYVLVIERDLALPYFKYVTVEDENVDIDSVELILGNVDGEYDVAYSDAYALILTLGAIGEENFAPGKDLDLDCEATYSDAYTIIANLGEIWDYAEDAIDDTVE